MSLIEGLRAFAQSLSNAGLATIIGNAEWNMNGRCRSRCWLEMADLVIKKYVGLQYVKHQLLFDSTNQYSLRCRN